MKGFMPAARQRSRSPRRALAGGAGAVGGSSVEAVHLRHRAIHEDEVVGLDFGQGDGGDTVGGKVHVAAEFPQKYGLRECG